MDTLLGWNLSVCLPRVPLRVDASEQGAPPSPVFGFLAHRGHENLPRKNKHAYELAGHAMLIRGGGHDSRHTVSARMPSHARSPRSPNGARGKLRPSGERICPGLSGTSAGARVSHTLTCARMHTHWPLCAPTPSPARAHPDRRAHAQLPSLGAPTMPGHTLRTSHTHV